MSRWPSWRCRAAKRNSGNDHVRGGLLGHRRPEPARVLLVRIRGRLSHRRRAGVDSALPPAGPVWLAAPPSLAADPTGSLTQAATLHRPTTTDLLSR